MMPLFTFRFIGGGFNQVYAETLHEAIEKIKEEFWRWPIDFNSIKCLNTEKDQTNYYNSMGCFD